MTGTYHSLMQGYAPIVKEGPGNPEAEKYGRMWEKPEYRAVAPGEGYAQLFLNIAKPAPKSEIIDFGCGTGRGALMLALLGQCRVTMIDFVRNSLDTEISDALVSQADLLKFVKADIEQPIPCSALYGYCTDVMEHIPPDKVDRVLVNILKATQHCFFSISTIPDVCGKLIDEELHLTIQPYEWWHQKLIDHEARIEWSHKEDGVALFYVTAWTDGQTIVDKGAINNTEEAIRENVKKNIASGWNQIEPHEENEFEVAILGGGPSLNEYVKEIHDEQKRGVHIVTLNGAYNWALNHGFDRVTQVMVDSRPFNARFTKPVMRKCLYLISSQCHPAALDGLPKDRTWLWHSSPILKDLLDEQYKQWWHIPGGSTVLLRAIPLLRLLGYKKFILYGVDSCIVADKHHAYAQPENDSEHWFNIITKPDGRAFKCYPWMCAQAQEFMDLIKAMGDEIELQIRGDGLLAHILNTGAEIAEGDKSNGSRDLEDLR
jgi:SAM-dependent methyltransferase